MRPQQSKSENRVRCWAPAAVTRESWVPVKGEPQTWEDAWNELRGDRNQPWVLLSRAWLTPGLVGYGMDFSVNQGRDQSHKETSQRKLMTCIITGRNLRPAAGKHELQGSQVAQRVTYKMLGWGVLGRKDAALETLLGACAARSESLKGQEEDRLREFCSAV